MHSEYRHKQYVFFPALFALYSPEHHPEMRPCAIVDVVLGGGRSHPDQQQQEEAGVCHGLAVNTQLKECLRGFMEMWISYTVDRRGYLGHNKDSSAATWTRNAFIVLC